MIWIVFYETKERVWGRTLHAKFVRGFIPPKSSEYHKLIRIYGPYKSEKTAERVHTMVTNKILKGW